MNIIHKFFTLSFLFSLLATPAARAMDTRTSQTCSGIMVASALAIAALELVSTNQRDRDTVIDYFRRIPREDWSYTSADEAHTAWDRLHRCEQLNIRRMFPTIAYVFSEFKVKQPVSCIIQ